MAWVSVVTVSDEHRVSQQGGDDDGSGYGGERRFIGLLVQWAVKTVGSLGGPLGY